MTDINEMAHEDAEMHATGVDRGHPLLGLSFLLPVSPLSPAVGLGIPGGTADKPKMGLVPVMVNLLVLLAVVVVLPGILQEQDTDNAAVELAQARKDRSLKNVGFNLVFGKRHKRNLRPSGCFGRRLDRLGIYSGLGCNRLPHMGRSYVYLDLAFNAPPLPTAH
ncbi:hypothetical protein lerEdw1_001132 [Lerista edwardsae]|nr:hypothetical protein lerEdw1_001135 [Lerista edwardsae]KAJ6651070.1 hypothetical protein lerEdw1_001132 [Lerista edwardsae]